MAWPSAVKRRWIELASVAFVLVSIGLIFVWSRKLDLVATEMNPDSEAPDETLLVDITLVQDAEKSGAVCLDGSPPAYHLHQGSGSGSRNWLIFLEGGGWCTDHGACARRSRTRLGSSALMEKQIPFEGILSPSRAKNPDFYNWNRVKVRYCDGASFGGDVEKAENENVMYRGQRIWKAVVQDLLSKGMMKAEMALLAGCSAGGLATLLHCNSFKEVLPEGTFVKCLNDGGYFMDAKDLSGQYTLRSLYKKVVDLQNVSEVLPKECVTKRGAECFFPEHIISYVEPQVFFLNSGYDTWQIQNVLLPDVTTSESWNSCKRDAYTCSKSQLKVIEGFRNATVQSLIQAVETKEKWSSFINSCFVHCQTGEERSWNGVKVDNKSIRESVGDWYFGRDVKNTIDCLYPCNPTCTKWTGWGH